MSLPQASSDWTNGGTFFFIERDKTRTRGFNNKNNSNESKELRFSLEHMWVIWTGIEEIKPKCMAPAEEEGWEAPPPTLRTVGVEGGSRRGLRLGRNSWCVMRDWD